MASKYLIVSLHDYHPASREAIEEQVSFLSDWGVKTFSILVIPHYHRQKLLKEDKKALAFLDQREEEGDDLVLHGFYHDRKDRKNTSLFWNRFYSANEGEFHELSDGEIRHRVERGQQLWENQGWKLDGFIAPAWLLPFRQDQVLKRMGLNYTTRLRTISLLQRGVMIPARSMCYSTRASWRRAVSLQWNRMLFSRLRKQDIMRLSLHPDDLRWNEIKQQIKEIIEIALNDGYQPVNYSGCIRQVGTTAAFSNNGK